MKLIRFDDLREGTANRLAVHEKDSQQIHLW